MASDCLDGTTSKRLVRNDQDAFSGRELNKIMMKKKVKDPN
jgi:hypothetical protein